MTLHEAIDLIRPGVIPTSGTWADIGAGTGLFTEALMEILEEGKVMAVDKNTHSLYQSKNSNLMLRPADPHPHATAQQPSKITVEIYEADFNKPMILPSLDGILMANALHYAIDHTFVLKNVLSFLKSGGTFILIEYDTDTPNSPWVPNPISLEKFRQLCKHVGLKEPREMGRRKSIYQDGEMYVVTTHTMD